MNGRQRGVALITVLLVVAIVTVVSAGMMARQHLAIRGSSNQIQAQQALHYAMGGEALAKSILLRDREADAQRAIDHPGEAWARPMPAFALDHGEITLRIEDLAGRFNLNSLVRSHQPNEAAIAQFRRLLAHLDIQAPYAERLVDWLDANQDPSGAYGAEDNAYLLLDPPYRTGGRRLYDVSELRLLLEMSDEHYRRLAPHVSALPADVALNINTAGALVIASLDDDISLAAAEAAVRDRPASGHTHAAAFLAQPSLAGLELKGTELAVNSQFFHAVSEVRLAERRQVLVSLLKRESDGSVRVLQRHLGQPARLPEQGN